MPTNASLGHGRRLGGIGGDIDFLGHARVDRGDVGGVELELVGQHAKVPVDGIVLSRPPVDLARRNVRLVVVLRVPFPTIGHELDERDPFAPARTIDRLLGDVVDGKDIIPVGANAGNAIGERLVLELDDGRLARERGRVGVAVVLDDDDERTPLDGREVDPLVKGARRRRAVADVDQTDARLVPELERQRHAHHHGNHIAQMRDLADEAAIEVAVVDVQLAASCGRVALRHVLPDDLGRLGTLHQHRAEVANERREHVAPLERERAPDGVGLLDQRSKEAADDLRLAVQVDETLLERARQSHPVVQLELLGATELRRGPSTRRRPARRAFRGGAAPRSATLRPGAGSPRHQYAAASLCEGSAWRCTRTKKRLTLRSRRLSPT